MPTTIKLIHAHSAPRCQHIKTNGLRCQSPAMKQRRLCYYHEQYRLSHPGHLQLPLLEDANAVQMAIQQVIQAIALGTLDNKRAGLILYGLQTAAANLPNCDFEPDPDETDEIILSTADFDTISDLPCHDPECPDNTLDDEADEADEEEEDSEDEEDDEDVAPPSVVAVKPASVPAPVAPASSRLYSPASCRPSHAPTANRQRTTDNSPAESSPLPARRGPSHARIDALLERLQIPSDPHS